MGLHWYLPGWERWECLITDPQVAYIDMGWGGGLMIAMWCPLNLRKERWHLLLPDEVEAQALHVVSLNIVGVRGWLGVGALCLHLQLQDP